MNEKRFFLILICVFLAAFAGLVAGCGDDDNPLAPTSTKGTVVFHFDHEIDGAPLVIQSSQTNFPYTNTAGNPYNVDELKYFVSDFRLHRSDGSLFGVEDFLFREAADGASPSYTIEGVPPGTYVAVSFTFGLDAEKNRDGLTFANGDPVLHLIWPNDWGDGFHYMEMNGHYKQIDGVTVMPYRTHTGRRFVSTTDGIPPGPDTVARHHFFEVKKSITPFSVKGGSTWDVQWIMNINGWYHDPVFDLNTWFPNSTVNIMVNIEEQELLQENGTKNLYRVVDAVKP